MIYDGGFYKNTGKMLGRASKHMYMTLVQLVMKTTMKMTVMTVTVMMMTMMMVMMMMVTKALGRCQDQ